MTTTTLTIDDDIWSYFKKSIPRDILVGDAVSLLIMHYCEMGNSGKLMLETLAQKNGFEKKEIRAKFLKVVA